MYTHSPSAPDRVISTKPSAKSNNTEARRKGISAHVVRLVRLAYHAEENGNHFIATAYFLAAETAAAMLAR